MGQKISPISLRVGVYKDWKARWFSDRRYSVFLKEDFEIREYLEKKLRGMGVHQIEIERSPDVLTVIITTSRPGLIIGRSGSGIDELRKSIVRMVKRKTAVKLDVHEFKNPESSARIVSEMMAEQIEKRIQYRRVLKQSLAKILANKEVKGAKVTLSGRLDGNDIARTEHLEQGSLPLQTLRANVDYAQATAYTTYGTVGIKVWIYKGMRYE